MQIGVALLVFGIYWCWKAVLSHFTTTGTHSMEFVHGFPTPKARGRLSHAAGQRAAAFPCLMLGVALVLPGLFCLIVRPSNKGTGSLTGAVYLLVVQIAGILWAKRRADDASEAVAAANPNEPPRY